MRAIQRVIEYLVAVQALVLGSPRVLVTDRTADDNRHIRFVHTAVGSQSVALEPAQIVIHLAGADDGTRIAEYRDITLGADTNGAHPYFWSTDGMIWDDDANLGTPATLMIRARGSSGTGTDATASFRNGSGVNPLCYAAAAPEISADWTARVNHAFYPSASFTQIHFRLRPATGPTIAAGELLLDFTSARVFISTVPSNSLSDLHQHAVPDDASLVGISLSTQAVILGPPGIVLCNAYDLVVGC